MGRLLALTAALIAAALIAWFGELGPKPVPATAQVGVFSAERAMADVRAIAAVPHPLGSKANQAVRDRLMARMTALGLSPEVHRGVGVFYRPGGKNPVIGGGRVENIIGVLPGRNRTAPAVALMAHYDSVPGSPGAADDAAGVASTLEVIRALKTYGVPARDVVVVLTDGEEAGLLGADAFFNRDASAKHIGFIFNMEARGAAGRVQMFQAGEGNGAAIGLLRRTAPDPKASSLTGFIYGHMPNDTDFTVSKKAGVAGLNYAFLGHQFEYHSPTSTPATLDVGTLQDMGQQVLPTLRAVAYAPSLPAKTPDLVYNPIPGGVTLAYPPQMGWLILAGSALLIVVAVVRARRIEAFSWTDVLRGGGASLFAVVGGCTLLHFARLATGSDFGFLEQRFLLAQADRWEVALVLLALGFLILAATELARGRRAVAALPLLAGLGSCAFAGFDKLGLGMGVAAAVLALVSYGRPVSRAGAWTGVLALGLILATAVQVMAPVTDFVFSWPLAIASLSAAITALSGRRGAMSLIVMAVLAALGVGWIGGLAHNTYLALDLVELLGLPILLTALLIWPLAQPSEGAPPARLIGPALMIAGLAVLAAVRFGNPYDARHPQATYVGYQIDQDARQAWRFTSAPGHAAWTDMVLEADEGRIAKLTHWSRRTPVDAAPAPFIQEPAPQISVAKQADGTLLLHAAPPLGARTMELRLKPDTVVSIQKIAGVTTSVALKPGADTTLQWAGGPEGLDMLLKPGGPGKLQVSYIATLERWPPSARPLPKRPANLSGFSDSDSTSLTGRRSFSW